MVPLLLDRRRDYPLTVNPLDARSRYTGGTVYQRHRQKPVYRRHGSERLRPESGIPNLFSNVYWHRNARVIEIQTRQQLKNKYFHETQRIFMNKFCITYELGAVIFQSYLSMLYIRINVHHLCLASIAQFCDRHVECGKR